jgi:hypothetical protein
MDLDDFEFRCYYQFYTLGMFITRCGEVLRRITLGIDDPTEPLPDANNWAAPFFTSTFSGSDGASVPATQMEVEASLFISSHFPNRTSTHHACRQTNLNRRHSKLSYADAVEMPCYFNERSKGIPLHEMEGIFKPNTHASGPADPPSILQVLDPDQPHNNQEEEPPAAHPAPPENNENHQEDAQPDSSAPASDIPPNNPPPPPLSRYDYEPADFNPSSRDPRLHLQRPCARESQLLHNPFAALDHIALLQCVGGNDSHFAETHHKACSIQGKWAESVSLVAVLVMESVTMSNQVPRIPGLEEDAIDLDVERALKMLLLLATLLLRKPPNCNSMSGSAINKVLADKMDMLLAHDIQGLVASYEADIIAKKEVSARNPSPKTEEAKAFRTVREAMNLLKAGKIGKAQNILLSKGVADPKRPEVIEQLSRLHPERKEIIPDLSAEQIQAKRASIDRTVFDKAIADLESSTAPGLAGLRNAHIRALMFNSGRQVSPKARQAMNNLFNLLNLIAGGNLPWYFFVLFYSIRQVAIYKKDPSEMPPGVNPSSDPSE